MKPGEIRPVTGGYGLMRIRRVEGTPPSALMVGHGPAKSAGHWFPADRLGAAVGPEAVKRERAEARARGVGCNNPDCWCREVRD